MASEPILAVQENIDDQIIEFCKTCDGLTEAQVVRDIARIVCIVHLVQNRTLDGKNTVLCGGMAMRCLDSPRMSVFDGDTSSRSKPDPDLLRDAITHDEEEITIKAGAWRRGDELITFRPVEYDARFSQLAGSRDEFSLSVSHRGVEEPAIWRPLNHRYPFQLLAQEVDVPIMHPDEILAEKIVAWWLFGHAKHYNDIAFLAGRMVREDRRDHDAELRASVSRLIDKKLHRNREVSSNLQSRVDALTRSERRRRLEEPDEHVDPDSHKGFNSLAYLHGTRPDRADVDRLIQRVLLPLLFD
jgi:Nucleotidyl transferase AbiEii toxin, Type IV TA system